MLLLLLPSAKLQLINRMKWFTYLPMQTVQAGRTSPRGAQHAPVPLRPTRMDSEPEHQRCDNLCALPPLR